MSFRVMPRRRVQAFKSGLLYTGQSGYGGGAALSLGELKVVPLELLSPLAFDQVQVEVTTAATAGGILRVGWWRTDPLTGLPGALGAEFGSIDTTTIGVKTIVLAGTLPAGDLWLGGVAQVAACSVIGSAAQAGGPMLIGHTGTNQNPGGYGVAMAGALTAWPGAGYYAAPGAVRVYVRKS